MMTPVITSIVAPKKRKPFNTARFQHNIILTIIFQN